MTPAGTGRSLPLLGVGALAWMGALAGTLALVGPCDARFAGMLRGRSGVLVHRPVGDAWLAAGIAVAIAVAIVCATLAVRHALDPETSRWPGVVGAVMWILGFGLLTLIGPTIPHVFADVVTGFWLPPA